uniref:Uncharacterized protein n=1 Tax=Eptatretus burgeri TaxID=7764 RepID=A0A8C4PWW6_EPTBU
MEPCHLIVMLGKNSGVATRLTARYPYLFTWHCMNHRLELAVSDAVDEVQSIIHFKAFMQKIHNLYSQSNKNSRELLEAALEVGSRVKKIGRVLNTLWVASSFRAVKAVWRSYEALNRHFENAVGDQTRNSKERQTYRRLAHRMQSKEFLCDLGLMYDVLSELASLSQQLQAHSITLLRAEQLSSIHEEHHPIAGVIQRLSRRDVGGGIKGKGFGTFWIGFPGVKWKAHINQCKAIPTKSDQQYGEAGGGGGGGGGG